MTTPVTPSVLNAPPKNGSHPTQPQQPVDTKQNAPAAPDKESTLTAREQAIEKREKTFAAELQNYKNGTGKELGRKLSEYEQLKKRVPELEKYKSDREQRDQLRKLNPVAALEEDFGKDWADKVTGLRVNGVPPTDMIAAVVQQLKAEFKADLDARDAKTAAATTAAEQSQVEETRAMVSANSAKWYEANAKNYPVFERLGDAARIGQILGDRIEQWFRAKNELITEKQAADMLESELLGLVEHAVKQDKYKPKLQGETKPANVSPASGESSGVGSTGSTQHPGSTRRTLDNSMTASTSDRAPPRSEEEKLQRARERFIEERARSKG